MKELKIGEVYYRATYPDVGLLYPLIESFVYLGKNLAEDDVAEPEGSDDIHYFQPARNYATCGPVVSSSEYLPRVVCLPRKELDDDMFDMDELIREIGEAAERRKARRISAKQLS